MMISITDLGLKKQLDGGQSYNVTLPSHSYFTLMPYPIQCTFITFLLCVTWTIYDKSSTKDIEIMEYFSNYFI